MASLAQTPDGDIEIEVGRTRIVTGPEEKAQKIRSRFRLFEGEWFLDTRIGVPWFRVVFEVKNPDLDIIKRLFRWVILSVPGIVDVEELNVAWDKKTRELTYSWRATDDEGTPITGTGDLFIPEAA